MSCQTVAMPLFPIHPKDLVSIIPTSPSSFVGAGYLHSIIYRHFRKCLDLSLLYP